MNNQKPQDDREPRAVRVLAINAREEDQASLAHIFGCTKWTVHCVQGRYEALEFLQKSRMPVLLCDCQLPDGNWKDLLDDVAHLPDPPLLIVTSLLADDCLWAEALNRGAYDVLAKPFEPEEVVRSVSLAWLHWKDRWGRAASAA